VKTRDFQNAEMAFLLSNTPLFLLRKLRSDPVVAEIAHDLSGKELFDALHKAAQQEPKNIVEAVVPYVYLVALSVKGDFALLKQASDVRAPYSRWFKHISEFLLQSFIPTSRQAVSVSPPSGTIQTTLPSADVTIPTSSQTVTMPLPKAMIGAKLPSSASVVLTNIRISGR
jgi:hypothetical protein